MHADRTSTTVRPPGTDRGTTPFLGADPPRTLLRIEGAVLLAVAVFLYARYGASWWLFALLLFAPDVGMLGYLANTRIGAATYNLFHMYLGPALLLVVGITADRSAITPIAIIWFAHIGLDRALGYGLKYGDGFTHTHLGTIGRPERR
jgi:hypothetical protein